MKNAVKIIIGVLLILPLASSAQEKANRQIGVNVRNVWFGSNLQIMHRIQREPNRWRRFDLNFSPYFNNYRGPLEIGGVALPKDFRQYVNANSSIGYTTVNEHFSNVASKLDFYHGMLFGISYSHNNSKSVILTAAGELTQTQRLNQNINLSTGYMAGLRYSISDRFGVGLDANLRFTLSTMMSDREDQIFDSNTGIISPGEVTETEFANSFGIGGGPITRIWLLFNLSK